MVEPKLQDNLARLVPNARDIMATERGHNIQQDQPELVIAAVRKVVDAVRDPSTPAGALSHTSTLARHVRGHALIGGLTSETADLVSTDNGSYPHW